MYFILRDEKCDLTVILNDFSKFDELRRVFILTDLSLFLLLFLIADEKSKAVGPLQAMKKLADEEGV